MFPYQIAFEVWCTIKKWTELGGEQSHEYNNGTNGIINTAAYVPFSKDIVERQNAILKQMACKTMDSNRQVY